MQDIERERKIKENLEAIEEEKRNLETRRRMILNKLLN